MIRLTLHPARFFVAVCTAALCCFGVIELKAADIATPDADSKVANAQIMLAAEVSTCLDGISKQVQCQLLAGVQSFTPSPEPVSDFSSSKTRSLHFGGAAHVHAELDDDWEPTIPQEEEVAELVVESSLTVYSLRNTEVYHSPQSPPPERLVFHC